MSAEGVVVNLEPDMRVAVKIDNIVCFRIPLDDLEAWSSEDYFFAFYRYNKGKEIAASIYCAVNKILDQVEAITDETNEWIRANWGRHLIKCPICNIDEHLMWNRAIAHLNDHHSWSREQIADWLETLDLDWTVNG